MVIELKFKSVAWKWIFNVFLVMFLVIFALEIIFCVYITAALTTRVQTAAEEYAGSFITPLSNSLPENFESTARSYCEAFAEKDKIEIQVLDASGNVLISTTGFEHTPDSMPDYEKALSAPDATGLFSGKVSSGERVMCETTLLKTSNGTVFGAVRWITSLNKMNSRILWLCVGAIIIGVAVLGVIVISGMYFIKSIVRPIRDVSNISRKIALGDFNSRIDINANNEIGELCDSINYMASELKQAENLKNDFISSVSHELRTPLTAIRGWAETAKLSIGTDEETVEKGLDVVLKESERLRGLVEELLDFSRMQSGHLSMSFAEIELSLVVREAADMYKELAKNQNVELVYIPAPNALYCVGDINRIKQVFINVIDNALKYNQPGGKIIITERLEEGCVHITVSDTGVGIPAADLDRVKEKFYKANNQVRGSGIGLAVADEIIKQHNGFLLIDSTEGVGTTVTIVLPTSEINASITPEGENNEL